MTITKVIAQGEPVQNSPAKQVADLFNNTTPQTTSNQIIDQKNNLELKDVKPPVLLPSEYRFLIYSILGILFAALMYILIKYFIKRNNQQKQIVVPMKPAWEIALEKINQLSGSKLLDNGEFNGFFTNLTEIVRRYFEDQFNVKAPEMTTEEFMNLLKNYRKLNFEQKTSLAKFLEFGDMVKFAKFTPKFDDGIASLSFAKKLIEDTSLSFRQSQETTSEIASA